MMGQVETQESEALKIEEPQEQTLAISEQLREINCDEKDLLGLVSQPIIKDEAYEESSPSKKKSFSIRPVVVISLLSLAGLITFLVSLPSFLSCGNRAKSSEAKAYVGSMNRGQQAFWLENQSFGTSIPALNLGIKTETTNYKYDLQSFKMVSYHYAVPKVDEGKSFVGAVFLVSENKSSSQNNQLEQNTKKELETISILCESEEKGLKRKLLKPILENGKPICAEGVAHET